MADLEFNLVQGDPCTSGEARNYAYIYRGIPVGSMIRRSAEAIDLGTGFLDVDPPKPVIERVFAQEGIVEDAERRSVLAIQLVRLCNRRQKGHLPQQLERNAFLLFLNRDSAVLPIKSQSLKTDEKSIGQAECTAPGVGMLYSVLDVPTTPAERQTKLAHEVVLAPFNDNGSRFYVAHRGLAFVVHAKQLLANPKAR